MQLHERYITSIRMSFPPLRIAAFHTRGIELMIPQYFKKTYITHGIFPPEPIVREHPTTTVHHISDVLNTGRVLFFFKNCFHFFFRVKPSQFFLPFEQPFFNHSTKSVKLTIFQKHIDINTDSLNIMMLSLSCKSAH